MRWSLSVGRVSGIRVELHATFLLFIGWIAAERGLLAGRPGPALAAVTLMLLVFACVVLHELGHALVARRFGVATRDIVLLPIGGVARLERLPDRPRQELLVALAGPAVNLAVAALLVPLVALVRASAAPAGPLGDLLETLLAVNLALVAFNLIPAFPMDGGRVLRALLALRLSHVRATRIASFVGQGAALVLGAAGALALRSWVLGLAALFVFVAAGEERALAQARGASVGPRPLEEPAPLPSGPPGPGSHAPAGDATATPESGGGRRQAVGS